MAHQQRIIITVLLSVALAALNVHSAPLPQAVEQRYQLISLHSGKFLSVTPSGDVHAKATDPADPSTEFYLRTHEFPHVSYESVQNVGHSLVVDADNGLVRVEEPNGQGNELFEEIGLQHTGYFALKSKSESCYVAFDMHGAVSTEPGVCDPEIQGQAHTFIVSVPSSASPQTL